MAEIIRKAEVVFIAGGDQANYIRGWKGTPVESAINEDIAAGKPIGGTSAGLAVEGEFVYSATGDKPDDKNLSSTDVLPNPYFERVTLVRDFLKVPHLENLITDSHFAKRDRMGRTLGFLARIMKDGWSSSPREVAIDEKSAVLVEADGKATVVGTGKGAYFLRPTQAPEVCEKGVPLTFRGISVYRVPAGGHFDLTSWTGDGGSCVFAFRGDAGRLRARKAGREFIEEVSSRLSSRRDFLRLDAVLQFEGIFAGSVSQSGSISFNLSCFWATRAIHSWPFGVNIRSVL